MLFQLILLIAGFISLVVGADQLVKGAGSIAKRYGLSSLFIGLTVVAFGSSMPELVVNLFAVGQGAGDIALGNVMGSNIANILLGLGIAAMIRPLIVERAAVWREVPFAILGSFMLLALSADMFLSGQPDVLTRGEGLALIGFFSIFIYFTFKPLLVSGRERWGKNGHTITRFTILRSVGMILIGLAGLAVGGSLIVNSATSLATSLGVSQALVTLTAVALGTSLPEIAATIMATYRGHTNMAIGNIIGSVTFNTLWIIGLTVIVSPIAIYSGGVLDIFLAFLATALFFPFIINQHRIGRLDRWEGVLFVLAYVGYILLIVWRG